MAELPVSALDQVLFLSFAVCPATKRALDLGTDYVIVVESSFQMPGLHRYVGTEWPDEFVKSSPKCGPTLFSSKWIHNPSYGNMSPKIFGYYCNYQKTARRKQSPNKRKFAQSGHTAYIYVTFISSFASSVLARLKLDWPIFWKGVNNSQLFSPIRKKIIDTVFHISGFASWVTRGQGDQIGRIFDQWVIVYLGQVIENYRCIAYFGYFISRLSLCTNFGKKWVGLQFGWFF
jgi:hypothetical protein